jgi:hypothetical protein
MGHYQFYRAFVQGLIERFMTFKKDLQDASVTLGMCYGKARRIRGDFKSMGRRRKRGFARQGYHRLRQVLFAFSSAGLGLGILLLGLYAYQRHMVMLGLGLLYIILAVSLFGVRSILAHLDDLEHRRSSRTYSRSVEKP